MTPPAQIALAITALATGCALAYWLATTLAGA